MWPVSLFFLKKYTYIYIYIYILKWIARRRDLYFFFQIYSFINSFRSYIRVCFQVIVLSENLWQKVLWLFFSTRLEWLTLREKERQEWPLYKLVPNWKAIKLQTRRSWSLIEYLIHKTLWHICGGARGVVVIVVGNGHGDTSSNPGRDWLISHSTNTLGEGMNPIILPPAMGK